jgi:hypothetical protein
VVVSECLDTLTAGRCQPACGMGARHQFMCLQCRKAIPDY